MLKSILLCLIMMSSIAHADDFGQAAIHYQNGKFIEAARLYEQGLSKDEMNGSLLFNIGNSYYKAGRLGDAMAAYLKAQELTPRDPDIRANIEFLRSKMKNKVELRPSSLDRWFGLSEFLNEKEVFWGAIYLGLLGGVLLSFAVFGIKLSAGAGGVSLLCSGLLLGSFVYRNVALHSWGAVSEAEVEVFAGPSDKNSVVVFQLFEGVPVKQLERQGEWTAIELQDQKRGWVRSYQVRFF